MRIIIDHREQNPFSFGGPAFGDVTTEPGTLQAGDYSLVGLEHLVAIERKSLSDLVQCLGRERSRFERELMRLKAYETASVVVEAPFRELAQGKYKSKLNPRAAVQSVYAFMARYRLPFWFCETRLGAVAATYSMLRHYARHAERIYKAVSTV